MFFVLVYLYPCTSYHTVQSSMTEFPVVATFSYPEIYVTVGRIREFFIYECSYGSYKIGRASCRERV